jgi:hypothetical protein
MALGALAAFVFVLGDAFGVAAYAVLTPSNVGTSSDFIHASDWLQFVAGVAALAAVCAGGWELVLQRAWEGVWEIVAGTLGTLIIAIGLLISAVFAQSSSASNIVGAVGFGVWALLVLSRAARRSLAEQGAASDGRTAPPRQAILWLVAASGILLLAIGFGFTPDISSKAIGIAAGCLEAVGVSVLLGALAAARTEGYLPSRAAPIALGGLVILAVAFASFAVVSGVVFGPNATLTGIRVGIPIAITIELIAVATLGFAAWTRVRELVIVSQRGLDTVADAGRW